MFQLEQAIEIWEMAACYLREEAGPLEFLSIEQVRERVAEVQQALSDLFHSLVTRPRSRQWSFLAACVERTLAPGSATPFDSMSRAQAAQLKFEVEDKLRRYYRRSGLSARLVFTLMHELQLRRLGIVGDDDIEYPQVAGYCVLVSDANQTSAAVKETPPLLEKVVAEGIDAEFRAYEALPTVVTTGLERWFCREGPAYKEILNVLARHSKRGWVISNPWNPSTKRLQAVKIRSVSLNEATVGTVEYWYLRWWNTREQSYAYYYRETNRQTYVLRQDQDGWKIFQNLRPSPRSSTPNRRVRA